MLSKIAIALGLSLATLVAAAPTPAEACGGYVRRLTPEEEVRAAAIAVVGDRGKTIHHVQLLDDGSAEVQVRWAAKQRGRIAAQYLWFVRGDDGAWKLDGKSYAFTLPARSTRASSATAAR